MNYVHCGRDAPYDATPTEPQRLWSDPEPQPGLINFPLIEDNPRMWHRTPLTKHAGLTEFFRPLEVDTGWESYPRHEEVVQSGRIWWSQYAGNPGSVTALRMEAAKRAYNYLFDPATFTLPRDIFTTNPPQGHIDLSDRKALVRTGKPHSEDLIDFIRSRGSARCNLPRGFLQDSDSATGLPPCFNRRPGEGLEDVAGIWLAFEDRKKFENGVYRRPRGVRTGAGQVPPVPQGIWDDPPVIPVFGDWDYPRQKWNWDAYLACLRDREQMLGPAAEYRAEFVFDPQAWQHNRTITRTGVQTWQVYSPYDIGRRQYTVGPQYYSMPNTAPPGPSTQAYAPAQPGTVPHNLRQPQNSMSWSQITAQVKTGKQAQSGKQPHRYGQTGSVPGVKNMGLQNAFAVSKVPALGKRARFSDEDHFGEMDAAESARLAKSIRV